MGAAEARLAERLCELGRSMFQRGLTFGSSGNLSVRTATGWLMTPTDVALGDLDPAGLARLDEAGRPVGPARPTKEAFLHLAMYRARPDAGAVVHLHATHSAAVSCLAGLDPADVLPPLTPYFVMRVGRLPLVPYARPGDPALAEAVGALATRHAAVLLANHGPVVAGTGLDAAVHAIEELEETAKLFLLLHGRRTRPLDRDQIAELHAHFPPAGG